VTQQVVDDLRADLGDSAGAFTNEELTRLLERSQDSGGNQRYYVALAMGLYQLLNQAARFADYTVNEAAERRGEIWEHLRGSLQLLMDRDDVRSVLGQGEAGGFQRRRMTYTRTVAASGEYNFPSLINPWG
jgi:hypothetical protein